MKSHIYQVSRASKYFENFNFQIKIRKKGIQNQKIQTRGLKQPFSYPFFFGLIQNCPPPPLPSKLKQFQRWEGLKSRLQVKGLKFRVFYFKMELELPIKPNLARVLGKTQQELRSCKQLQDGLFSKVEHWVLQVNLARCLTKNNKYLARWSI